MKIEKFDLKKKVLVVAELSANHNHNYDIAVKTIEAAKEAGVDAIKFQTYTPDTLTIDCNNEFFKIQHGTIWDGSSLYELYQKAHTPWEWQPKLKKIAEDLGLICFSSPFDFTAVDFLENMNVGAYKIASPEIFDIPLIEYCAKKMKPIIISTGLAEFPDIELAIKTCKKVGNNNIILLKCTSAYPTLMDEVDLITIPNLEETFGVIPGLSDHTLGYSVATASVALGARLIEKHFIIDKSLGGPDAAFSLEPKEMKILVDSVRDVESALGKVNYTLNKKMKEIKKLSRSLFVVKDIKKGEILTKENVRSIRPGQGMHPKYYNEVLGKKFTQDVLRGTPLKADMIEK
jgi:pseudaminic acid synthase